MLFEDFNWNVKIKAYIFAMIFKHQYINHIIYLKFTIAIFNNILTQFNQNTEKKATKTNLNHRKKPCLFTNNKPNYKTPTSWINKNSDRIQSTLTNPKTLSLKKEITINKHITNKLRKTWHTLYRWSYKSKGIYNNKYID